MPKNKFSESYLQMLLVVGISFGLTALYLAYDVAKFISVSEITFIDGVEVRYSPINPEASRPNTFLGLWIIPIVFVALSVIVGGTSAILLHKSQDRNKIKDRLLGIGHKVMADFVKIENGMVVAEWRSSQNNKKYIFKCPDTGLNLEKLPKNHLLAVYIDPKNPKEYYMALPGF